MKQKIYQYTVFFDRNKNGSYTITVPTLPGLITEGSNLQDARKMAEDAIKCYIGGLKKAKKQIPQENEVAQLRLSVKI